MEWEEHPRVQGIYAKQLLTVADNPLASVALVQVPPGAEISRHSHGEQVETVYVLKGRCVLTLGDEEHPFNAGQIVALPVGFEHELRNAGSEPAELITVFTPPVS
jgi:quercetin dioxygenase-like cupin family protein